MSRLISSRGVIILSRRTSRISLPNDVGEQVPLVPFIRILTVLTLVRYSLVWSPLERRKASFSNSSARVCASPAGSWSSWSILRNSRRWFSLVLRSCDYFSTTVAGWNIHVINY